MSKFNATRLITLDGTQIHFVTRGRSKLPTQDEIEEYCKEQKLLLKSDFEDTEKDWEPPNKRVFLGDLRSGLVFCSNKYGVTEDTIERYVREMAPHINMGIYKGDANG